MPRKSNAVLSDERQIHRIAAETSIEYFINFVQPRSVLGNVHREVFNFWCREDASSHQLLLLPRDHRKSTMLAYRIVWTLTKDPTTKILLISSTSNLATKQLKFIKDILTSDRYRMLWPEMVEREEAKREKWTEREISIDHPLRKEWNIRDPSIFTAGLSTNIVGMHADVIAPDDVVVQANAYTEDGREKVKEGYGYLSSVASVNSKVWAVGTRYHPNDLYGEMMKMEVEEHDEYGNLTNTTPLFECFERQVESIGDGTGEFIWPRQQGQDGKWFGFDQKILAQKRAQYLNKLHFRAQYYNDPHDVDSSPIQRDLFQYFDAGHLHRVDGRWFFKGERLNLVAAVDFAYTLGLKSDYTSIVVVGIDGKNNYYVLEIDRFKTDKMSEYFNRILKLHQYWGFTKIRAEVNAAQKVIVTDLKENYIKPYGLSLSVDEYHATAKEGAKAERIMAILEPKYANRQMWHVRSGNSQILEEELLFANPAHDDVKDALAAAVDLATGKGPHNIYRMSAPTPIIWHSRFGGIV